MEISEGVSLLHDTKLHEIPCIRNEKTTLGSVFSGGDKDKNGSCESGVRGGGGDIRAGRGQ